MVRKTLSLSFLRPRSPLQNNEESPTSPASPLSPPALSPSTSPTSPSSTLSLSSSNPSNSPTNNLSLAPPSRLHLRTLLRSPPLPDTLRGKLLATVPKQPYPWIWKCHLCSSVYRLGVTRRCLEDGHYFCSLPSPPPSPSLSTSSFERGPEDSLGAGFEDTIQLMRKKEKEYKEKKRRKRKVQKACRAEFDYTGWSTFNTWRREIRAIKHGQFEKLDAGYRIREIRHWQLPPLSGRGEASERGEGKKDCWRDCDFPSECLNARVKEREWTLQRQKMLALEEEWVRERARLQQLIEAGPETPDSVMEGNADVDADDEEEVDTVEFYDAEECSPPLAQDADLIVANHKEEDEAMGIGDDNLGPLGTDCDGLGEESKQALYTNCRRKSLDSVAEGEVPPNSPLKECSFGFEDVELGCNIWVSERERKWNEDVQMAEVEEKGVYF